MERKIGEIFEYNGEWYQCVRSILTCSACEIPRPCTKIRGLGYCSLNMRNDKEQVVFKKLEKVGEPHFIKDEIFEGGKVYVQNFKVYEDFEGHKPICNDYIIYDWKNRIISIEIKQNKEDMSNTETLWYGPDKKEAKSLKLSNLKPFSLEAAKAGKPVCTRDGRKARIICFDRRTDRPIVALIERDNHEEILQCCFDNGRCCCDITSDHDLMMLPEKKDGWINIYNADTTFYYADGRVFETKDEAVQEAKEEVEKEQREKNEYIDTIRVEWEE